MKKCPSCSKPLRVEEYEGVSIWRCPGCRGALVSSSKYTLILARREKSTEGLTADVRSEFKYDSLQRVRCPGCSRLFDKRPLKGTYGNMSVDVCEPCGLLWFDGGELATAQLAYEMSDAGIDAEERKRRTAEIEGDPQRKAAFAEAMKRVPEDLPCGTGGLFDQSDEIEIDPIYRTLLRLLIR